MSQLHPTKEDDDFAYGHCLAGLRKRVEWVKKLRKELLRLLLAHPEEAEKINKVLSETREWL